MCEEALRRSEDLGVRSTPRASAPKLIEQVEKDAKKKPKDEAEVNPEEVISEALYIVGDLSGFPEDTELLKFPEVISIGRQRHGPGRVELTPEEPEQAEGRTRT